MSCACAVRVELEQTRRLGGVITRMMAGGGLVCPSLELARLPRAAAHCRMCFTSADLGLGRLPYLAYSSVYKHCRASRTPHTTHLVCVVVGCLKRSHLSASLPVYRWSPHVSCIMSSVAQALALVLTVGSVTSAFACSCLPPAKLSECAVGDQQAALLVEVW